MSEIVNYNAYYYHLGRLEQFLDIELFSFAKELGNSKEILRSIEKMLVMLDTSGKNIGVILLNLDYLGL